MISQKFFNWGSANSSPPPGPTLGDLSLDDTLIKVGVPVTINILGATAESTITGSVPAGLTLNSGARTITGTPTIPATNNFDLIETLAGSPNSPRTNPVTLVVDYNPQFALFGAGEQGGWWDFSDLSTMFQDTAGTVPVTAVGQRIARINDKSGNNNHATRTTTAQQPILRQTAGGLYYAEFDGIDDSWVTGNINFSATDEMTIIAGLQKLNSTPGMIAELSANFNSNTGTFFLVSGNNTGAASTSTPVDGYTSPSRGSAAALSTLTAQILHGATDLAVISSTHDISGDLSTIRRNGVAGTNGTSDKGAGNFAAAQPLFVGRRGGASLPFNGRLFGLIVRGAVTSGAPLTDAETYMAGKTGVTL